MGRLSQFLYLQGRFHFNHFVDLTLLKLICNAAWDAAAIRDSNERDGIL